MSKSFLISAITVTDLDRYAKYRQLSTEAIQSIGARVLVRGGKSEVLEGTFPQRIVVVEFDGFEAARDFYYSDGYVRARNSRAGAADVNMVVVEGT